MLSTISRNLGVSYRAKYLFVNVVARHSLMQDLRVYLKLLTTCLNVNDAQTFYSIGRLLRHPPSARRWGGERVVRRRPTTTSGLMAA